MTFRYAGFMCRRDRSNCIVAGSVWLAVRQNRQAPDVPQPMVQTVAQQCFLWNAQEHTGEQVLRLVLVCIVVWDIHCNTHTAYAIAVEISRHHVCFNYKQGVEAFRS